MKMSTLISLVLFTSLNGILFLEYFITDIIENTKGSFISEESQEVMNINFNIFFFMHF